MHCKIEKNVIIMINLNVYISSVYVNAYVSPNCYVIDNVNDLKALGIIMSSNCSFEQHIIELYKWCTACGWILRTFISRESTVMMTLFKSLVLFFVCPPHYQIVLFLVILISLELIG